MVRRLALLLMLLLPRVAVGAIAVSEPTADINSTANATSYAMAAFTPAANSFLVVMVCASATLAADTTMSGGSLTWTLRQQQGWDTTSSAYLYTAPVGGSPASTTITFSCASDAATGANMIAYEFTGRDPTTPIVQSAKNGGTSANPTITFASALNTNNGYAFAVCEFLNPPAGTPPTSWTEIADAGHGTPTAGAAGAYRAGGETGTTYTYTVASAVWASLGIEIAVEPPSVGQPTMRRWEQVPGMPSGRGRGGITRYRDELPCLGQGCEVEP